MMLYMAQRYALRGALGIWGTSEIVAVAAGAGNACFAQHHTPQKRAGELGLPWLWDCMCAHPGVGDAVSGTALPPAEANKCC